MRRIIALAALALAIVPATLWSGATASASVAPRVESPTAGVAVPTDDVTPVAVPEPTEQAIRFYRSGNVLWCLRTIWELSIPALILFTGFSARLKHWAERLGRSWLFALAIYLVASW